MNWLVSFLAGRWLVLVAAAAVLGVLLGAYGLGRSHANTRWEARMAEQELEARIAAQKQESRWEASLAASDARYGDAQAFIAARDGVLVDLAGRLRQRADQPRLPPSAAAAGCPRDLAAERERAGTLADLLAEGADLGRQIALERDRLASQVTELIAAWPR